MSEISLERKDWNRYSCEVALTRIKAALAHVRRMRRLRFTTGITQIAFVKSDFMRIFEETLRMISFTDEVYELLFDFVKNRRLDDICIVTPDELPDSRFWSNFHDFCAVVTAFPSTIEDERTALNGIMGFGSRGADYILSYFNDSESDHHTDTAEFTHNCSNFLDISKPGSNRPRGYKSDSRRVIEIDYGKFWTCPACGGITCSVRWGLRELWRLVR